MTFDEWWEANRSAVSDMSRKNAAKAIWDAGHKAGYEEGKEDYDPMSTTAQPFET